MEVFDSMDAYEVAGSRRSAAWCLQYEYEASLGVTSIFHLAWCSLANLVGPVLDVSGRRETGRIPVLNPFVLGFVAMICLLGHTGIDIQE